MHTVIYQTYLNVFFLFCNVVVFLSMNTIKWSEFNISLSLKVRYARTEAYLNFHLTKIFKDLTWSTIQWMEPKSAMLKVKDYRKCKINNQYTLLNLCFPCNIFLSCLHIYTVLSTFIFSLYNIRFNSSLKCFNISKFVIMPSLFCVGLKVENNIRNKNI